MRELLFRGKTLDVSEWVYGYYVQQYGTDAIYFKESDENGFERLLIYSETVGQYTGLNDKNGVKIFEGDICDFTVFRLDGSDKPFRGSVIYDGSRFVLCVNKEKDVLCDLDYVLLNADELGVIGNVHDNPELLEVQK